MMLNFSVRVVFLVQNEKQKLIVLLSVLDYML